MTDEKKTEFNKKLCKKYPFLIPKDWRGHSMLEHKNWHYTDTWRDDVSFGWLHAFDLMCEELLEEITASGCFDTFELDEVKSKFGELRIYSHGGNHKTDRIIDKWCAISGYICEMCGKPNARLTKGWIMPVCYDCWCKQRTQYKDGVDTPVPTYGSFLDKTTPIEYPPTLKITRWVENSSRPLVDEIDLEKDFQRIVDDFNESEASV